MNNEEVKGYQAILEKAYAGERAKTFLEFAEKTMNFCNESIPVSSKSVPAPLYCMELYHNASTIGNEPDKEESYQIVSLLVTLERMQASHWSFGAELTHMLRQSGLSLKREEVYAFMAQAGSLQTNPNKGNLMDGNMMAVAIYAGELASTNITLFGKSLLPNANPPDDLVAEYNGCWVESSPAESLENLLKAFVPAFIGKENEDKLIGFVGWLRKYGFYTAPASAKYHSSYQGGLLVHTCKVIARHIELQKPQTREEFGKIILADTCHDICKADAYEVYWKNEKVPGPDPEGKVKTQYEPDGMPFHWAAYQRYAFKDKMPLGHGYKSLYIASGYFGAALTDEVAAAIDAHMRDETENPMVNCLMGRYPLGAYLHIADMMASHLDELEWKNP